ncbi:hypothetical protein AUJ46_01830 [Candidatus Peregrinibacteria bacterium CG1_02_54_53]|nr:MAG: hypothetical protein AUJ46_01830 [Candidatus Peregrinibacteria bacterium CG1_02_54_53]
MRTFLLVAIGLQTFFGTGCRTALAHAQESATETEMAAPTRDSHETCGQESTEPDDDEGGLPCLGHCLAEATQRSVSDSSVQLPTIASLALGYSAQSPVPSSEQKCNLAVFPCSLSPPPIDTVVLRQ